MLVWLTLPFYDFCGFKSVAVNSVYKLQFSTFIIYNSRLIQVAELLRKRIDIRQCHSIIARNY